MRAIIFSRIKKDKSQCVQAKKAKAQNLNSERNRLSETIRAECRIGQ
ncbi:hypothetical protein [Vibrio vulnificus YJ016]|uniref:Uncharacterized protein n=1 Tax=Vibrio vulnificus (strain YJ016) TaxID=196600 RepID=Q7MPZ8_VIBVY|nr:hypothetical protein [Vibrio vulnificus YJ016]